MSGSPGATAPRWWLCSCSTVTPAPSIAAITEPADVPTRTSASRGSQPYSSCTAWSAPIVHAAPRTPPAPRTSPRVVISGHRSDQLGEGLLDALREDIDVGHGIAIGVEPVEHPAVVRRQPDRHGL